MGNLIDDKSFDFGVKAVRFVQKLRKESNEYELINQFLRSATSVGANVAEARYAQSDRDFLSKMAIARKEANEANYWLRLLAKTGIVKEEAAKELIGDASELLRILTAIIKTKLEKMKENQNV